MLSSRTRFEPGPMDVVPEKATIMNKLQTCMDGRQSGLGTNGFDTGLVRRSVRRYVSDNAPRG
jgi:hypothetical protein